MGAGASTGNTGEVVIGDVVTVQLENYPKRVIGVISAVQETTCSVQVSNTEVLPDIPRSEIQRIAKWHEIEVGDIVKVKEEGSWLYYEGTVIRQNDDGTYKVHFGDDEEEDHIVPDRVLKLMSGRLEHNEWMMYKETADYD